MYKKMSVIVFHGIFFCTILEAFSFREKMHHTAAQAGQMMRHMRQKSNDYLNTKPVRMVKAAVARYSMPVFSGCCLGATFMMYRKNVILKELIDRYTKEAEQYRRRQDTPDVPPMPQPTSGSSSGASNTQQSDTAPSPSTPPPPPPLFQPKPAAKRQPKVKQPQGDLQADGRRFVPGGSDLQNKRASLQRPLPKPIPQTDRPQVSASIFQEAARTLRSAKDRILKEGKQKQPQSVAEILSRRVAIQESDSDDGCDSEVVWA